MKTNLTKQYPFTGDYYSYSVITNPTDPDQTSRVYTTIPTQVKMALSINLLGELVIDSPTKMQLDGILKNVLDKNSEEIYESGEWQIGRVAPNLNPIGTKEDCRYYAKIIGGII